MCSLRKSYSLYVSFLDTFNAICAFALKPNFVKSTRVVCFFTTFLSLILTLSYMVEAGFKEIETTDPDDFDLRPAGLLLMQDVL